MTNFNYNLTIACCDSEMEIRTNDVDKVCAEWFGCQQDFTPDRMVLVDGYTGEVLAEVNFKTNKSYYTRVWHYVLGGYFIMNF